MRIGLRSFTSAAREEETYAPNREGRETVELSRNTLPYSGRHND